MRVNEQLCECCGVRPAYSKLEGCCEWSADLKGAWFSHACDDGPPMADRIRARRAKLAEAERCPHYWSDHANQCLGVFGHDGEHQFETCCECKQLRSANLSFCPFCQLPYQKGREYKIEALCSSCSRPDRPIAATHGEWCVYCAHSLGACLGKEHGSDSSMKRWAKEATHQASDATKAAWVAELESQQLAARRMAAADRRERPRVTAESKMLALPHPWSNCDE